MGPSRSEEPVGALILGEGQPAPDSVGFELDRARHLSNPTDLSLRFDKEPSDEQRPVHKPLGTGPPLVRDGLWEEDLRRPMSHCEVLHNAEVCVVKLIRAASPTALAKLAREELDAVGWWAEATAGPTPTSVRTSKPTGSKCRDHGALPHHRCRWDRTGRLRPVPQRTGAHRRGPAAARRARSRHPTRCSQPTSQPTARCGSVPSVARIFSTTGQPPRRPRRWGGDFTIARVGGVAASQNGLSGNPTQLCPIPPGPPSLVPPRRLQGRSVPPSLSLSPVLPSLARRRRCRRPFRRRGPRH